MESHKKKKYMSAAYRSSFAKLLLNIYLYCEEIQEGYEPSPWEREAAAEFGRLFELFIGGREDITGELDSLRDGIIGRVEVMTAFTDCFQIYEYVLNRVERRFVTAAPSKYTPSLMAERLVDYIAGLEYGAEQNEALRQIVAQLPVRLTRQKFYSIVLDRLSVFAGAEQAQIEDFLYMLGTAAAVRLPEHMEEEKELYEILSELRRTDYRKLDGVKFGMCSGTLARGIRILTDRTDRYVLLVQLVNDLYVLCLTGKEALIDASEQQAFLTGAKKIMEAFRGQRQDLLEELRQVEGVQESASQWLSAGVKSEGDPVLEKLEKLLSGSSFMSLEEKKVSHETADQALIEERGKAFCEDLDRLFADMQKPVVRAVMAKVLSGLPMVFQDSQEIREYIQMSLEGCSDYAEREACMELLEQELMVDAVV